MCGVSKMAMEAENGQRKQKRWHEEGDRHGIKGKWRKWYVIYQKQWWNMKYGGISNK